MDLSDLPVLDEMLTAESKKTKIKIKKNRRHKAIEAILGNLEKSGKTGYNKHK